jgi:hypothetical protein
MECPLLRLLISSRSVSKHGYHQNLVGSIYGMSSMKIISYLRVDPWALRLYHPEALLYSLRRSRRLYSGAEGWYNLNAHG